MRSRNLDAAIVAFPRLRPGLRAPIALGFGVLAIVNGTLHLIHVTDGGPTGSDVTGVLAVGAGVVLAVLGAAIPFVRRVKDRRTRTRRWADRAVLAIAGVVVFYGFVFPTGLAIIDTHKYREPIGSPPSAEYETVSFLSSDGLELSGWYRPSRNRAAVVVVHGAGSDRTGAVAHAQLLARHGYGVLVYDSRGRGESEGSPVGFGWDWPKDVSGALAFLRTRSDVDPERIGGLGLSRGADVLIQVAAADKRLKSVVSDGATGGSDFNQIYLDSAREPVELWDLPEVDHTAAIRQRPDEYERRVVGFSTALFDRWIKGRRVVTSDARGSGGRKPGRRCRGTGSR